MSHKKMIIMMLDILLVLFFPIVTLGEDFGLNPEMDSDISPDVIEIVISGKDTNKDKDEYKDENTNTNNTYLGIILPGYNGFQINGIFFRSVPSGGTGSGADLALIKTETNQIILPIGLQYYLGWPVLKVYGGFDILFINHFNGLSKVMSK